LVKPDESLADYVQLVRPDAPSVEEAKEDLVPVAEPAQVIEQGYNAGLTPAQSVELIRMRAEKEGRALTREDATLIDMLTVDNPNYSPTAVRYMRNQYTIEQMLAEELEKRMDDTSTLNLGLDALDRYLVRHLVLGMFEDVTFRGDRLAKEIQEAALTMDSPEEMKAFVESKIAEMDSEGVFSSENLMALMELNEAAINRGEDPKGVFKASLAGAEIAIFAIPTVKGLMSAASAIRRARGARTVAQKVAAVNGPEAGDEVVSAAIRNNTEGADEILDANPNALHLDTLDTKFVSTPDTSLSSYVTRARGVVQTLLYRQRRGDFGRALTEPEFNAWKAEVLAGYEARVSRRLLNFKMDRGNDGVVVSIAEVGKAKGGRYKTRGNAERAHNNMIEREELDDISDTITVQGSDESGWYLEFRNSMSTGERVGAVELLGANSIRESLARAVGSKGQTDDEVNNALALAGEAGGNIVQNIIKPLVRRYEKLPADSRDALDRAYTRLRDDPDLAKLRDDYNRNDMEVLLSQELGGRRPTEAEIEAIDAIMELEATSWYFDALKMQDRFVRAGGKVVESHYTPSGAVAKKAKNIPEDAIVVSSDGRQLRGKDVQKDKDVWELFEPIVLDNGDEIKYIHNPRDVREVAPEDALGRNTGGRRLMPKAKFFVGQTVNGKDRVFMAARTEAMAKRAQEELNTIFEAIRANGGGEAVYGTNLLDDVISKNNSWNPDIEDTADFFDKFVTPQGIDVDSTLFTKGRGEPAPSSLDGLEYGNYADFVKHSKRRSDAPLMEYGGGGVLDVNSVDSILGGASVASHQLVNNAWNVRAFNSWVRKAKEMRSKIDWHGANPDGDVRMAFMNAEVKGNSADAREMRHLQDIIKRRMMVDGPYEAAFKNFADNAADYILDRTGIDITRATDNLTNKVLSFNFHTTLGLFNLDQIALQASHALQVIAMDPRDGFKAAAVIPMLRASFQAPSLEIAKAMRARLGKYVGMSPEDMEELAEFINRSGRTMVGSDAIEHGTQYQLRGTGYWGEGTKLDKAARATDRGMKKVVEWGIKPFNEGEKMARYTSLTDAWMQYKRLNPTKGSSFTEEGRRWIMNKDAALSFNMTTTQRSNLQSGFARIPTQWLSYTLRSMEAVAFGRGLSKGERLRLAVMQFAFFGAVGYGPAASMLVDDVVEPSEVGGVAHRMMKRGLLDLVVSEITGEETAAAERFSPVYGAFELWDRVWNENTLPETLLGPTYSIPGDALTNLVEATAHFVNNRPVMMTEELVDTLRTVKSVDNSVKAYSIIMNGRYFSKGGMPSSVKNLSSVDAINMLLGFKPVDLGIAAEVSRTKYKYNKALREFETEIRGRMHQAYDLYASNNIADKQAGAKMLKELGDIINSMHYFTVEDRVKLKKRILGGPKDRAFQALKDAVKYTGAGSSQTIQLGEQFRGDDNE
jgi:hypothetical protein